MPRKPDYKIISRQEADLLFDSPGETYEPRGLFLVIEEVGGEKVFTAVRNLDGSGETEEFLTRRHAVMWLHGMEPQEKWRYRQKDNDAERILRIVDEKE